MRALKITIYALFALVIVAIIAAAVFVSTINPNNYKSQISAFIYKKTGAQVNIEGNLEISIFPWLGIRIHQVSLNNPNGFVAKTLVDIGEADVKVNFMPLLQGKVEVGDLTLKDVTINLQRQNDGSTNLDALMKQYHVTYSAAAAQEYAKATGQTASANPIANAVSSEVNQSISGVPSALASLAISNIQVDNANLNWVDQQNNQNIALKNLNFLTKNFSLNAAFPVTLSFSLDQTAPQKRAITIDLSADTSLNLDANSYDLKNLKVSGQFSQDPLNLNYKLASDIHLDLKNQTLSLANLSVGLNDLIANGNVDVTQLTTTPTLKGNLDIPTFSSSALKEFLPDGVKLPNRIGMQFGFQASPTYVKLSQLKLNLDDSNITGDFNYANFPGQPQDISFNLNANKINMNDYLPATAATNSNGGGASNSASPQGYSHTPIFPVALLKALQLNGSLKIGQVQYQSAEFDNVNFDIKTANQVFNSNLNASFMKANVRVTHRLDVSGATPDMSVGVNTDQVNIKSIMSLVTKHAFLKGTGTFSGNFGMRGNDVYSWVNSLSGNGKFAVHQGAIDGVDVAYYLDLAKALMNKQPGTSTPNTKQTPFDQFSASFTVKNGVFSNSDLVVSSGHMTANGSGQVNLPAQNIDYRIMLNLGSDAQVPLKITGPLNNPSESVDVQALLKQQIKKQTQQITKQVKQQAENTVKQQVNNLKNNLGRLFG